MSDEEEQQPSPMQIGDEIPNFTLDSTLGMITYHEIIDGSFSILVTFPRDFEAVGSTELGALGKLKEEFDSRSVKIFALSPDTKSNHRRWISDTETLQSTKITFPLLSDVDGEVSRVLGLCRPDTGKSANISVITAGLIVLVDIDKRIRYVSQYPATTGRNFYEILRLIDSVQLTTFHSVATPANWANGEDVFVGNEVSDSMAKRVFGKGFVAIKEWFRITPQPDLN